MATLTKGHTFASGDTVTATKLNDLVDSATISAIQTADISDNQITTAKIVDANVTDAKLATGAVTGAAGGGKLAASAINSQTVIADPLAATDEFLVWDASASALRKISWSSMQPSGSVIQTVTSTDGLSGFQTIGGGAFSASVSPKFIPLDTTIPQSDEGAEVATVTITPKYDNSIIRLVVSVPMVSLSASAGYAVAALFKDSDANAFATDSEYIASTAYDGGFSFVAENLPATTSAVTYKLRVGPSFAVTLFFGGASGTTRTLGNTMKVLLTATEIKV